jgi:hypothetical protein
MASTSFLDEITLIRSQAFLAKDTSSKGADRPKRRSNRQYLRMLAAYTSNMDAFEGEQRCHPSSPPHPTIMALHHQHFLPRLVAVS